MAHAIRLRISLPNAPDNARENWDSVRTDYTEVLEDDPTSVGYNEQPNDPRGEHAVAVARFVDEDDRDAIVSDLKNNAFPSIEWVVIDVHACDHDGDFDGCEDWRTVFTRGSPPEAFVHE